MKYIRAEPALTLRLAKAAIDAAKALKKASVAVVGAEGQVASGGDGGILTFTPVTSTGTSVSKVSGMGGGVGVGGGASAEKAQGIDWGSVIAEAGKEGNGVSAVTHVDHNTQVEASEEDNEEAEEEEEEGEDNVDSTEFDEVIEVEDVFGKEIAERAIDRLCINSIEEGEEGEKNDEDESEDEETDDSEEDGDDDESDDEDDKVMKIPAVLVPAVPVQTGDINFSEDFFPVLSAEGPKRSKKVWPVPTNENIDRTPVTNIVPTSSDGTGNGVDGVSAVEASTSAVWGTGAGTGVKNWSQVAALSVKAAVATATDNSHTMTNRYMFD